MDGLGEIRRRNAEVLPNDAERKVTGHINLAHALLHDALKTDDRDVRREKLAACVVNLEVALEGMK